MKIIYLNELIAEYNKKQQLKIDLLNKFKNTLNNDTQAQVTYEDFQQYLKHEKMSDLFASDTDNIFSSHEAWRLKAAQIHNNDPSQSNMAKLPLDVSKYLLKFLPAKSQAALACVNTSLRDLVDSERKNWQRDYTKVLDSNMKTKLTSVDEIVPLNARTNYFTVRFHDNKIRTYDGYTCEVIWTLRKEYSHISPYLAGDLACLRKNAAIDIFNNAGKLMKTIDLPENLEKINSFISLSNGSIALGLRGKIYLTHPDGTNTQLETPRADKIENIAELSNGNLVASDINGNIILYHLKDNTNQILYTHYRYLFKLIPLADHKFLSIGGEKYMRQTVNIWNSLTGENLLVKSIPRECHISCVPLDNNQIIVSYQNYNHILDLQTNLSVPLPSYNWYCCGRPNLHIKLHSGNILNCLRGGSTDNYQDTIIISQFDYESKSSKELSSDMAVFNQPRP